METLEIKFIHNVKLIYENSDGKIWQERLFVKGVSQEFPLEIAKSIIARGGGVPAGPLFGKAIGN